MEFKVKKEKVVVSAISFNNAKTLSRPKLKSMRGWGEKKRELGGRDIPINAWDYGVLVSGFTIVNASNLLNLFEDLMNLIVYCIIRLFVTTLKRSLPYKIILDL